jgi:hypothetical protein
MADREHRHHRRHAGDDSPTPDAGMGSGPPDLWFRIAALAGAATLPLAVASVMLSDVAGSGGLNPGSSDAQLLEVFGDFQDRHMLAAALAVLAAVATLVFLGPLWARLRVGSEALAVVAVGGGIAAATLWLGWASSSLAAATAADFHDEAAARFLLVSDWESARTAVGPYLAMVGAATVAGFRHHAFGRWFNAFGLVFTVLLVLGLFPTSPAGLMGLLATMWVACASLVIAFSSPPATMLRPSGASATSGPAV